jgi:hypothetical protein
MQELLMKRELGCQLTFLFLFSLYLIVGKTFNKNMKDFVIFNIYMIALKFFPVFVIPVSIVFIHSIKSPLVHPNSDKTNGN